MITVDDIRPYKDEEVQEALQKYSAHPMIAALLNFTFPEMSKEELMERVGSCSSIRDFQTKIVYHSIREILDRSSEGFTTSGFEKLEEGQSYLFISNHRDIILDTSLLNVALYDHNLVMTASAIGDNLVKKPFLLALSRLNRNFLIMRNLSPRQMLQSSMVVSTYIRDLITEEKRSVWLAQREGRTKDGNDRTQQGVLKMLTLANKKEVAAAYFKKLRIVPVSISYEYDPTDVLKMPELMARHLDVDYVKSNNEDFNSILKGAVGQKKRIHITAGEVFDAVLDDIFPEPVASNVQLQDLADHIDRHIHLNYRLWPSNYIAYDLLHETNRFGSEYTPKEQRQFERRIKRRVEADNLPARMNFLKMYANPVINRLKEDSDEC